MCVERVRSIILAIAIGLSLGFLGSKNIQFMFITDLILIVALLVDGFSGFCPIRAFLSKILPRCKDRRR
jgi:hypothetical protein